MHIAWVGGPTSRGQGSRGSRRGRGRVRVVSQRLYGKREHAPTACRPVRAPAASAARARGGSPYEPLSVAAPALQRVMTSAAPALRVGSAPPPAPEGSPATHKRRRGLFRLSPPDPPWWCASCPGCPPCAACPARPGMGPARSRPSRAWRAQAAARSARVEWSWRWGLWQLVALLAERRAFCCRPEKGAPRTHPLSCTARRSAASFARGRLLTLCCAGTPHPVPHPAPRPCHACAEWRAWLQTCTEVQLQSSRHSEKASKQKCETHQSMDRSRPLPPTGGGGGQQAFAPLS